ncbi:MAG: hypothetical protein LC647_17360 [Beggiatoa sp.]|nr:hypothetical protein [Beggiatoa sp.]
MAARKPSRQHSHGKFGRIVEVGAHQSLMDRHRVYAELPRSQFKHPTPARESFSGLR